MTTYTVEPFDFDGSAGIHYSVTQCQLRAALAPYVKVPYIADGWHNNDGVSALNRLGQKGIIRDGDTVTAFSLGCQIVSLYLSRYTPPPGVRFVLCGDTFWRNQEFLKSRVGIPLSIKNEVILLAHEFDGWSDWPDKTGAPGYQLAVQNALAGMSSLHNYVTARLDDPSYVVTKVGNITAKLIPTQKLPLNYLLRSMGNRAQADALDAQQRPLIAGAYSRPSPSAAQLAAASSFQVGIPPEKFTAIPQAVADIS